MIVRFLKWALSKFENKPAEVWSFPTEQAPKTKPKVAKATTRAPKKAPVAIKTAAKKTVKKVK